MTTYNANATAELVGMIATLAAKVTLHTHHAAFAEFAGHTTDVTVRVYRNKEDRTELMYKMDTYASKEWFELSKGETYKKLQEAVTYLDSLL